MDNKSQFVNILGVNVNCDDKWSILDKITRWAQEKEPRTITYVNAHCLNLAFQNKAYRGRLNQADLVYSDGISVVWASRFLGGCPLEKFTGREWIFDLCELAIASNFQLYILAGAPGIAKRASEKLLIECPDLQITGTSDGYFSEKNNKQILEELNTTKPHILLVGMGSPQQENWISLHRNNIKVPICWSVGALFDYIAGVEPSVPSWLNALGLEWLWRMFIDPIGKWKRYILGNPMFVYRVFLQKLRR